MVVGCVRTNYGDSNRRIIQSERDLGMGGCWLVAVP